MTLTGPHGPAWFDISSPDAARARAFYQEMFGWPVNVLDDTYALVAAEGAPPVGGIGQAGPESPYTGFVAYFEVDNVDTALARARELGGSRTLETAGTGLVPVSRIRFITRPARSAVEARMRQA